MDSVPEWLTPTVLKLRHATVHAKQLRSGKHPASRPSAPSGGVPDASHERPSLFYSLGVTEAFAANWRGFQCHSEHNCYTAGRPVLQALIPHTRSLEEGGPCAAQDLLGVLATLPQLFPQSQGTPGSRASAAEGPKSRRLVEFCGSRGITALVTQDLENKP